MTEVSVGSAPAIGVATSAASVVVAPATVNPAAPLRPPDRTGGRSGPAGGALRGVGSRLLAWLGGGSGGDGPAAALLAWTVAAASRRSWAADGCGQRRGRDKAWASRRA